LLESEVQALSLRIDELAQQSGVPSRTIRFYNTQGLLPAPIMRGRVAYYNQEHLLILALIRELKEHQNLSLETIKQLLKIRAEQGEVQMRLALKKRLLHPFAAVQQQVYLLQEDLIRTTGTSAEYIENLVQQGLLFPTEEEGVRVFSSDDVLLLDLYKQFASIGLPLALPALIRFQLRQIVRSEVAAFEQYLLPHWQDDGLALAQQTEQFEKVLALTDTLISIIHRKLLYQV
jgi:DNA-binding transcriptional MerR regulator